jgi:hypothetical protein
MGLTAEFFGFDANSEAIPQSVPRGHARSRDRLAMTARLASCVHPRANSAELGVEFVLADTLLPPHQSMSNAREGFNLILRPDRSGAATFYTSNFARWRI